MEAKVSKVLKIPRNHVRSIVIKNWKDYGNMCKSTKSRLSSQGEGSLLNGTKKPNRLLSSESRSDKLNQTCLWTDVQDLSLQELVQPQSSWVGLSNCPITIQKTDVGHRQFRTDPGGPEPSSGVKFRVTWSPMMMGWIP